jgi:hypothetical protein
VSVPVCAVGCQANRCLIGNLDSRLTMRREGNAFDYRQVGQLADRIAEWWADQTSHEQADSVESPPGVQEGAQGKAAGGGLGNE